MSLKLGNDDVAKVMLGGQEVSAIYKGVDEVWSTGGSGKPIENISDAFSTYLYRGTGAAQDIENGVDLDGGDGMVWIKNRSAARDHSLYDTERGAGQRLRSNGTEQSNSYPDTLSSFNSDGFSLGADGSQFVNNSGEDYASWTFRKAPKFFDVVTYTGDGSVTGNAVQHNLGVKPGAIWVKRLDSTGPWIAMHRDSNSNKWFFSQSNPDKDFGLNTTNIAKLDAPLYAEITDTSFQPGGLYGQSPNVRPDKANASGGEYVAYLFAHDDSDESLIKCGSYKGNKSTDGPEIDLGWQPQWLLFKSATTADAWTIFDAARGIITGGGDPYLMPDNSGAEIPGQQCVDLMPTGFKIANKNNFLNGSGEDYIYMAIKADPNFRMPPEWEQMNQEVAEKIARRDAAKEAITEKVKDSKDIKDDG